MSLLSSFREWCHQMSRYVLCPQGRWGGVRKGLRFACYHLDLCYCVLVLQSPVHLGPSTCSASLLRLGLWVPCGHSLRIPLPTFCICLSECPLSWEHLSTPHFSYLHWDMQELPFVYIRNAISSTICLTMSCFLFPSTVALHCWQRAPCVWSSQLADGKWDTKLCSFHPDLQSV